MKISGYYYKLIFFVFLKWSIYFFVKKRLNLVLDKKIIV